MPQLRLESANDSFDLDSVLKTDKGVQVLSGVAGLGLPPVAGQWLEGAGDGATFRGSRALSRTVDLPILIADGDRESLKLLVTRLARMMAGPCTLRFVEDDGSDWSTTVYRVGGGDYVYGQDTTGELDLLMVLTVRAGDPFFTSSVESTKTIQAQSGEGLLPKLMSLKLSSSQTLGEITLDNTGEAPAYPVWKITGPGTDFEAISPTGETLAWSGTLTAGQSLTIDTKTGSVTDHTGANRYAEISAAPRFWSIPPGTTTATVTFGGTSPASMVRCTWKPRKWMVI